MALFVGVLLQILPLYLFILLGYIVGRVSKLDPMHVSKSLIYMIAPIVIGGILWQSPLSAGNLILPLIYFLLICVVAGISYAVSGFFWQDKRRYLLSSSVSVSNSGYFGIPVAMAVLPADLLGVFILIIMGATIFQSSIGYYILNLGTMDWKDSLRKLLKLPVFYAIIIGVVLNFSLIPVPEILDETFDIFRKLYIFLGTILIGLSLSKVKLKNLDKLFVTVTILFMFIIWPLVMGLMITLDYYTIRFLSSDLYKVFFLFSILPVGVNIVAYATETNMYPEKVALSVMVTTIIALFVIPIVYACLFI